MPISSNVFGPFPGTPAAAGVVGFAGVAAAAGFDAGAALGFAACFVGGWGEVPVLEGGCGAVS